MSTISAPFARTELVGNLVTPVGAQVRYVRVVFAESSYKTGTAQTLSTTILTRMGGRGLLGPMSGAQEVNSRDPSLVSPPQYA
jgi:hypothetical protein